MTSLADRTWPEVEEMAARILAVPVGSTEQHGPHLPLSTDTDVATALAAELACRRTDVVVAPPLPYGASGEHAAFPGTLSIGHEALELLLIELGRSASLTFRAMLLVVGHGGNAHAVSRAVRRLRYEGRQVLAWSPKWRGDWHAGRTETSVQLALDPARVRLHRAEAGTTENLTALMPALREHGVRPVSPNGVLGDPAGATADQGRDLLRQAADDLVSTVDAWVSEMS